MSPLPLFRHKPAPPLLDLLLWDRFVAERLLANVDGALAGTFAFRGPDLEAATAEEIETLSAGVGRPQRVALQAQEKRAR